MPLDSDPSPSIKTSFLEDLDESGIARRESLGNEFVGDHLEVEIR